jgi:hypothetical protein
MSVTYFGGVSNTSTGTPLGTSEDNIGNNAVELDYASSYVTVPGSGSASVVSLGMYCRSDNNTAKFRLAIYGPVDGTHNNQLVMQGATALTAPLLSPVALSWVESTSFTNSSGTPISSPVLTGGAKYRLVASAKADNVVFFGYGTGGTHNHWGGTDYTGGFPATLSPLANDLGTEMPDIRVGVNLTITGTAIPSLQKVSPTVTGKLESSGGATPALKRVGPTVTGNLSSQGTGTPSIKPITSIVTGQKGGKGWIAPHLKRVTLAAAGWVTSFGTTTPSIKAVTASAAGQFMGLDANIDGIVMFDLKPVEPAGTGVKVADGTSVFNVPSVEAVVSGWILVSGDVSTSIPKIGTVADGWIPVSGDVLTSLPAITSPVTGQEGPQGTAAPSLPAISAPVIGWVTNYGTATPSLKMITAPVAGQIGVDGTATPSLKHITIASLLGTWLPESTRDEGEPEVAMSVSEISDTTYALTHSDREHLLVYQGTSPGAWTVPDATGGFGTGWRCWIYNNTAGDLVITPDSGTIDGSSSFTVATDTGIILWSGGRSKWWIV